MHTFSLVNGLVAAILSASHRVHCMRDATQGGIGAILAEMALQADLQITLDKAKIPLREEVRVCARSSDWTPLFLASEGKLDAFWPASEADKVLASMRNHRLGAEASFVARVEQTQRARLVLLMSLGGYRKIDLPTGELAPRIC
ncbi:MAG: hypothetical protein JW950_03865 [Deltaproteobacteria bacterium]|nr:hypothetical protein [Deltaproteobacteria bacterium]